MIQKARQLKPIFEKTFKMAYRKCYEYNVGPDGELTVNPDEAQVVHRIFGWYIAGDGLGGIVADLEKQGILSPTGKPRWNCEASGRVLLPKNGQHRCGSN